jgi:hypothetical protein
MYCRNSSALFRFIIENNEVGTEDHAGVVQAWTSPDGMWNSMGRRVSGGSSWQCLRGLLAGARVRHRCRGKRWQLGSYHKHIVILSFNSRPMPSSMRTARSGWVFRVRCHCQPARLRHFNCCSIQARNPYQPASLASGGRSVRISQGG